MEHLDELLLQQIDPIKKAQLFGAIFDQMPTVEEIKCGTPKTPLFTGVNPVFQLMKVEKSRMVNIREESIETLLRFLEAIDQKLSVLGVVEINGSMIYTPDV